jgi:hypothetical protein
MHWRPRKVIIPDAFRLMNDSAKKETAYAPTGLSDLVARRREGPVALTGDDADELLPEVTKVLLDALLQVVPREEIEQQLDQWFTKRLPG